MAQSGHGDQPSACPLLGVKRTLKAAVTWRRFVACVSALPENEAAPLWQTALAEAQLARTTHIKRAALSFGLGHTTGAAAKHP